MRPDVRIFASVAAAEGRGAEVGAGERVEVGADGAGDAGSVSGAGSGAAGAGASVDFFSLFCLLRVMRRARTASRLSRMSQGIDHLCASRRARPRASAGPRTCKREVLLRRRGVTKEWQGVELRQAELQQAERRKQRLQLGL